MNLSFSIKDQGVDKLLFSARQPEGIKKRCQRMKCSGEHELSNGVVGACRTQVLAEL